MAILVVAGAIALARGAGSVAASEASNVLETAAAIGDQAIAAETGVPETAAATGSAAETGACAAETAI